MSKPEILQLGPFPAEDQQELDTAYQMHALHTANNPDELLAEIGPHIRGIVTRGGIGAARNVIEACPNLEIICVYGVGYDAVDMAACAAQGVTVTNTPDVLTKDVADLGVAMMLALGRNITAASSWVREGHWASKGGFALQKRMWGQRAGILGLGRIGTEIGRRLEGFDMQIAYSDISPKEVAWRFAPDAVSLARQSDVLFVTLAASDATRHIVDGDVLQALGPDGMLVNVSRASNVDEDALLDALENGRLGSAALDVFAGEPKINPRFLALDNVLLQPHHASATHDTRADMGRLMRKNLNAHFAGMPLPTPVT